MIRINLQTPENLALNRAVANAVNAIRNRPYAQRHPEMGRMINCPVCLHRHRSIRKCEPHYAVGRWDTAPEGEKKILMAAQNTRKGIFGVASVVKKRHHPHPNKKGLQLVERTRQLFPLSEPYYNDPADAMKEARTEAGRELRKEKEAKQKLARQQQQVSRQINRGLVPAGTRP